MRKGYYYFGECGVLSKELAILGGVSFMVSSIFFFLGGWEVLTRPCALGNNAFAIWCAFFLFLSIVFFLAIFCIHKVCRDIATLLKEIENKDSVSNRKINE